MDVALLLVRDRGEQRRFTLSAPTTTIGRREDCNLRIPLGDVSRQHCSISQEGGRLLLQDLGSSNGTYVNGRRVREAELKPGDQIRIGSLRFIVQVDGEPAEADVGQTVSSEAQAADLGDSEWDVSTSRTYLTEEDA